MMLSLIANNLLTGEDRKVVAAELRLAADALDVGKTDVALVHYAKATTFIVGKVRARFPVNGDAILDFLKGLAK